MALVGIIASMFIRGLILGLDFVGPDKDVDLVGDNGSGTGIPNVCIIHFVAQGNPSTKKPLLAEAVVNCNGEQTWWGSPLYPTVSTEFTINDPRVGPITVGFEDRLYNNEYPWPGRPWIKQDTWSQRDTDVFYFQQLGVDAGPRYNVQTQDCDGHDVVLRAGVHLEHNRDFDEYAIAFPYKGKALGCPGGKVKKDFVA